jgi:predicted ester cyclase
MQSISIDGDRVAHEWLFTGTHDGEFLGVPATGRQTRNMGATVERVNDEGLTVEETAYWDAAIFLRQVGALPRPTATSTA